jgi:hypothetical protein
LYQPLASGARAALAPVTAGAVASYFTAKEPWRLLPARSPQEPATAAATLSGPEYVCGEEQDSTPEVASLPRKLTVSGRLYQPFASAPRLGVAVTPGAVASYLKPNEPSALVLPARSRQEPETEAVPESGPP